MGGLIKNIYFLKWLHHAMTLMIINLLREDISIWYPKLKNGGYIAGDDFEEDAWPGVYYAINEYFNKNVTVIRDTTWIKQKNLV